MILFGFSVPSLVCANPGGDGDKDEKGGEKEADKPEDQDVDQNDTNAPQDSDSNQLALLPG